MGGKQSSNNNGADDDSSMGLYIVLILAFVFFSGGGWWYNKNYSDAALLAKSAAVSANNANNSANAAANIAASVNTNQADKAASDAIIAAATAAAAAAAAKKAADEADAETTKKAAAVAKKAEDDAKIALAAVEACKKELNIFTGTNGKKYICPPKYSFGNQNKNNYGDIWEFSKKNKQGCWMSDANRSDCGWGSCDPSLYKTPNGKKVALNRTFWNLSEVNDIGNYVSDAYPGNANSVYYINKPMEYSDAEYCK